MKKTNQTKVEARTSKNESPRCDEINPRIVLWFVDPEHDFMSRKLIVLRLACKFRLAFLEAGADYESIE